MTNELQIDAVVVGAASAARRGVIDRERVLALDSGLPIIVVDAPSGYGKTVLAALWTARQRLRATSCWVAVDVASRDPIRFLDQMLAAVGVEPPSRPEAGIDDEAARAARFSLLCAHLGQGSTQYALVVDDVHVIAGSASRIYLEQLLTLASDRLRICLTMQPMKVELGLGGLTARGLVT